MCVMKKMKNKPTKAGQTRHKGINDTNIIRQSDDVSICLGCQMQKCSGERNCYLQQKKWVEGDRE